MMGRTASQQQALDYALGNGVYVLRCGPYVKVGYGEALDRMKTMKTGNPYPIEIVFTLSVTLAHAVEQEAHRILRAHRVSGEWFTVSVDEAIAAIKAADKHVHRGRSSTLSEKQVRYVLSQIVEFPPTARCSAPR